VRAVGGIERILYISAVMSRHYELIGGWLVLKAFFSFLDATHGPKAGRRRRSMKSLDAGEIKEQEEIIMARYNGMLIGNALSLLMGLAGGAAANFTYRIVSPADKVDPHLAEWLTSLLVSHSPGS
jgi:hypothetical protein